MRRDDPGRLVAARFPDGKARLARVGQQPDGTIVRPLTSGERDECDYVAVPPGKGDER